jgi:hypothetical protein
MARFLLLTVVALGVFSYGIGVGRYEWPPWHVLAAGFRAVHLPAGMAKQSYVEAKAGLFARSRVHPDVVMIGDSLTEMGIWDELLEGLSLINRGISGDDSAGVLKRLPEVLGRRPRVICLEIGSNDVQNAVPTQRIIENTKAIADAASKAGSLVILQRVPFVVAGYWPDINDAVKSLNSRCAICLTGRRSAFSISIPFWPMVKPSIRAAHSMDCILTSGAICCGPPH